VKNDNPQGSSMTPNTTRFREWGLLLNPGQLLRSPILPDISTRHTTYHQTTVTHTP